jgi:Tfp pilus assembly major pilin PilA
MHVIKALRLFSVIGVVSLAGAGAANARSVTKTKADGNYAVHLFSDGTAIVQVSVFRNDTNTTAPMTTLNFLRETCDADGCSGIFGTGQIPSSDFKADVKFARLNVQLAAVAGYQAFSFVQPNDGERTQTAITPPNVNIEWKPLTGPALYQTKNTGTQVVKMGSTTTKTTGTNTYVQAVATGSIGGVPLNTAGSNNQIGSNENVNMEIIRE